MSRAVFGTLCSHKLEATLRVAVLGTRVKIVCGLLIEKAILFSIDRGFNSTG
jgi:hypothetical protein